MRLFALAADETEKDVSKCGKEKKIVWYSLVFFFCLLESHKWVQTTAKIQRYYFPPFASFSGGLEDIFFFLFWLKIKINILPLHKSARKIVAFRARRKTRREMKMEKCDTRWKALSVAHCFWALTVCWWRKKLSSRNSLPIHTKAHFSAECN